MSADTNIEWCDSTVNPTMGCDGCELWNPSKGIRKCYAGVLHDRYGGHNKGFSPTFNILTEYPGRMAKAARWTDLTGKDRPEKPWMNGRPRHIFISDMSDALSQDVSFEYLQAEIIDVVRSEAGRRHVWMWLTKRPSRMADFAKWLAAKGIEWPRNLMPGASITNSNTAKSRLLKLLAVPAPYRFLSVEPLHERVHLRSGVYSELDGTEFGTSLEGICLVIVGGESGDDAADCDISWQRDILGQCKAAGIAGFLKQLGSRPYETIDSGNLGVNKFPLKLKDAKGGDWSEWPADLRVRQMPEVRL